jgi:hypothetical protein
MSPSHKGVNAKYTLLQVFCVNGGLGRGVCCAVDEEIWGAKLGGELLFNVDLADRHSVWNIDGQASDGTPIGGYVF